MIGDCSSWRYKIYERYTSCPSKLWTGVPATFIAPFIVLGCPFHCTIIEAVKLMKSEERTQYIAFKGIIP